MYGMMEHLQPTNIIKKTGHLYDHTQIVPTFVVSKAKLLRLNLIDP